MSSPFRRLVWPQVSDLGQSHQDDGADDFLQGEEGEGGELRFVLSHPSRKNYKKQILRLTTPRLKSTPGAPFAQDDSGEDGAPMN